MRGRQKGFSLIELLIVVAIILIIAAVAVPSLLRSKMAANESTAVETIRAVNTAEAAYTVEFGLGYSTSLLSLGGTGQVATPTNALLVDQVVASGTKGGYTFTYAVTGTDPTGRPSNYSMNGNPISPGVTGYRYFFSDESYVIRANATQPATASDPGI